MRVHLARADSEFRTSIASSFRKKNFRATRYRPASIMR